MDPALEATYLAFDTLKKNAVFQLAAGTEMVDQVSFNGVRRGGRVLTVPVGWRIVIEFTNRDAELPHSVMVVAGAEPIPEQLPPPAFAQAQTVKIDEGLLDGDSDEIRFLADRAGRYLIACGVLGHAQQGQWLVLDVSASATVPTYR
jgi:FtsP/CotA-like multicopper oxidase with cupredoxin domain